MIVDASALLAILLEEPESQIFAQEIVSVAEPAMSAVNYWEVLVRVDRTGKPATQTLFVEFMELSRIIIEPVTVAQVDLARAAFSKFGKGRHPAGLNMGDCFAYALAAERNRPLLYKGRDFTRTDIESAV